MYIFRALTLYASMNWKANWKKTFPYFGHCYDPYFGHCHDILVSLQKTKNAPH